MIKHFNIRVTGRVQGVFYRASTRDEAERLGLKGFVMNEQDGAVYIEAEGEGERLDQLIEWCKIGPPRAKVEAVRVNEGDVVDFKMFEMKR